MDYFKPSNLEMMDNEQINHKFFEKVGSGVIIAGALGFFFYMNFGVETDVKCYAIDSSNFYVGPKADVDNETDVSTNFNIVFQLYTWSLLLDLIRQICSGLYYKFHIQALTYPIIVLNVTVLGQLAALILNHLFRLNHAGQVCSGDFLSKEELDKPENQAIYLDGRGKCMWVLLIISWVFLGIAVLTLLYSLAKKSSANKSLVEEDEDDHFKAVRKNS